MIFSGVFAIIMLQYYSFSEVNGNAESETPVRSLPKLLEEDIYKCMSFTAAHIDISHSITQNFSDYKDCQSPGLIALNRRNRHALIDIEIQLSWIVEVYLNEYVLTIKSLKTILGFGNNIQWYYSTDMWFEFL